MYGCEPLIPPLNIERFKRKYAYLTKCKLDEDLFDDYLDQINILGKYLFIKPFDLAYNGQLMNLALAHQLYEEQKVDEASAGFAQQAQFTKSVEQATAYKADLDEGYNGTAYGTPYWNLNRYGKQILIIVSQDIRRYGFTTNMSNCGRCARPSGDESMYVSDTLDINNVPTPKTINLRVNADKSSVSENKVLSIVDKVLLADTYTTDEIDEKISNSKIVFLPSKAISITDLPEQENKKIISLKVSAADGNSAEVKEDGIFVPTTSNPAQLVDGHGTKVNIPEAGKVAVDIQVNPAENNQYQVDENGGYVPPTDLSSYYTKTETETKISEAIEPLNKKISDEVQARQNADQQLQNEIDQTDQNLAEETLRATGAEDTLDGAITAESNRAKKIESILQNELNVNNSQLIAICSGYNALSSGIPVLADIQAAIAASSSGKIAISFNFASGEVTGLMIEAADVPDLYQFAITMTKYMQSSTEVRRAYPDFQMIYNGNNFLITNGLDNILLSIEATGNDLFKLSHNGNANILNINNSSQSGYYAKFELSELAGFDGIDNKAAITWSQYAIASPVCALKVPFGNIGDLMGFDTQFDNKNPDGAGQREYKVTLKFLVVTDSGVAGKSTFTIYNGSDANDGAFHMWTAGIVPEIDYSNQNTDHNDVYSFEVDNLRITPITINLRKSVFIENRLRKFYFGVSMKGWFQDPHTVNYKLYDYVEMILTPV